MEIITRTHIQIKRQIFGMKQIGKVHCAVKKIS